MLLRTLAFASAALLFVTPGNAATLYVAGGGTGAAPCTAAAPCHSLDTALGAAGYGDVIFCLSPPVETGFTIIKSVTIDCSGTRAPVRGSVASGSGGAHVGIVINLPVADPIQTVRLRGLTIDGAFAGPGTPRFLDRGLEIQSASAVYIEDCVISNVNQQGIYDHRTGGHSGLFIKDSVITGAAGAGIVAASAAVSGTVLDNVTLESNGFGIAVTTGNNVAIRNSVISGNSNAGIEGDSGSQITVYNSKISHNNIGVQSSSSVRISNNDIEFNSTAFNGAAATMGSNRFSGNVSMGTPRVPISGAPADVGP